MVGPKGEMMVTAEKPAFVESNIATWSDADYRRLLAEADSIFQAKRGTPEGARLDTLATLIEKYEDERYSISDWAAGGKMTDDPDWAEEAKVLPSKLDYLNF